MQHLSASQLQELKKQLEQNLAELEEYVARLDEEDPTNYEDRTNDNAESGDEAMEDYEIMENEVLETAADTSIAEIRAALERIEAGTYGLDEETGEPIPYERLKHIPTARVNISPSANRT